MKFYFFFISIFISYISKIMSTKNSKVTFVDTESNLNYKNITCKYKKSHLLNTLHVSKHAGLLSKCNLNVNLIREHEFIVNFAKTNNMQTIQFIQNFLREMI